MRFTDIKNVGRGDTIKNHRTGEIGVVKTNDQDVLRVALSNGRRVTVRPDDNGQIRWGVYRNKST